MNRTQLKDKIKQGPPASQVAKLLGVSRPTLYRQMDKYMESNDPEMNPYVKEYFDCVMMGKFESKEAALEFLEQRKDFMEMEKESHRETLQRLQEELMDSYHEYQFERNNLSAKIRVEREEEFDKKRSEIEEMAKTYGLELTHGWFYLEEEKLEWNKGNSPGDVRTTVQNFIEGPYIIVDLPYDECKNVTIEILLTISGEDFSVKKLKIEEGSRFAKIGDVPDGMSSKYIVHWLDDNKVRTVGPFPIAKTGY